MALPNNHYVFTTVWELPFPLATVWAQVADPEHWPQWWQGVREAEVLERGAPSGVGLKVRFAWQSVFPYVLHLVGTTTEVVPNKLIKGTSEGDLVGTGTWHLEDLGEHCRITYVWDVRTTRRWMNVLAPIGRPFFAFAHNHLMDQGEKGLRRLLETRVGRPAQVSGQG